MQPIHGDFKSENLLKYYNQEGFTILSYQLKILYDFNENKNMHFQAPLATKNQIIQISSLRKIIRMQLFVQSLNANSSILCNQKRINCSSTRNKLTLMIREKTAIR